jgi:predicted nucleic acid-binding protein
MTDSGHDHDPDHARIVADADVLAADLLVDGAAREALDHLRRHSWLELVVTDPLLDDAEAVITDLADTELAADWRAKIEDETLVVDQPEGDHPALAAAYRGDAAHVITQDGSLQSIEAGANLKAVMDVSIRSPDAFARVFDPAGVYELLFDDAYPGPDRDPRE